MVSEYSVKRLAQAICVLGRLNTSLHYEIGSKNPSSLIKHGQALKIVANMFGYATYKGFSDSIKANIFKPQSIPEILRSGSFAVKNYLDMIRRNTGIKCEYVLTTFSGLVCFIVQEFNDPREGEHPYITILNALEINSIWSTFKCAEFLKEIDRKVHYVNYVQEFAKLTANGDAEFSFHLSHSQIHLFSQKDFFNSLIRCAVFNSLDCIKTNDYKIAKPDLFPKTPQNALNHAELIFTLNSIVGDFYVIKDSVRSNQLTELAMLPFHVDTQYKFNPYRAYYLGEAELSHVVDDFEYYKLKEVTRRSIFRNCVDENALYYPVIQKLKATLMDHGVEYINLEKMLDTHAYVRQIGSTLTRYVPLLLKKDGLSSILDFGVSNYHNGTTANVYANTLKFLDSVLQQLFDVVPDRLCDSITLSNNGVIFFVSKIAGDLFTIKYPSSTNTSKSATVTALELSFIVNVLVSTKVVNECNDPHVRANKWLYVIMMEQAKHTYGRAINGLKHSILYDFAPWLGVEKGLEV